MGAGKSTVGRRLAEEDRLKFFDVDNSIEERTRMDIRDIFAKYGETLFREIETTALKASLNYDHVIVAAGGGLPCFNNNMEWMKAHGTVIYMQLKPAQLIERLIKERSLRPLIAGKTEGELRTYVQDHLSIRIPFYEQAHHTIDADQPIDDIIQQIRQLSVQEVDTVDIK